MPRVGLGVLFVPENKTVAVVAEALAAGYRSIDTASVYGNEKAVGTALAASGIPRDELFVTTKLWNTEHGRNAAHAAVDRSIRQLGLDHVDLYLIHWPTPARGRYVETWLAMEEILAAGKARAIGVSNFEPAHLDAILDAGSITPAVNQVELHPGLSQANLRAYGRQHDIVTEAWSPLGRGAALGEPVITAIARRLGRSAAQVVLRWHLQLGTVVIPKSVVPERIRANLAVFDFALTEDDMAAMATIETGRRTGPDPVTYQ